LVIGGSLGARRINQLIEKELDFFYQQAFKSFGNAEIIFEDYSKYNEKKTFK
jgi:UDP-N-acetylglucosamine--N-acetylmuramyl-(pentapeptide) pyrophosphoryl-undecaprenol N-acetylglucosamine transferase